MKDKIDILDKRDKGVEVRESKEIFEEKLSNKSHFSQEF